MPTFYFQYIIRINPKTISFLCTCLIWDHVCEAVPKHSKIRFRFVTLLTDHFVRKVLNDSSTSVLLVYIMFPILTIYFCPFDWSAMVLYGVDSDFSFNLVRSCRSLNRNSSEIIANDTEKVRESSQQQLKVNASF